MIKYTILKAIQISAIIILPICLLGNFESGDYLWAMLDLIVWSMYLSECRKEMLENKLHNKLY